MQRIKLLAITLIAALAFAAAPPSHAAQFSLSINIGPQPVCPYGYFSYRPYRCAPYGYYGPSWFPNGIFIGAGPWFRGPRDFHGYVDRYLDPRYGYRGRLPRRGERDRWHPDRHFRGNYQYDGRGNRWNGHDNGHHYGQYKHRDYGRGRGSYRDHGHGRDRGSHGDHGHRGDHGNHGDHGNGHGHGHGH